MRWTRRRLQSSPQAPRQARQFLTEFVDGDRQNEYLETGTLLVSELVTNAVQYAGTDLSLDLALTGSSLEIRVRDYGDGEPEVTPEDDRHLGGRGLLLVDRLAEEWGVQRMEPTGKLVWCRIAGTLMSPWHRGRSQRGSVPGSC
jgi:anti-sigma regulatory factor (Ser/Thr protein kinase)